MEFSSKLLSAAVGMGTVTFTSSWSVVGSSGTTYASPSGSLDVGVSFFLHDVNRQAPQVIVATSTKNNFFIFLFLKYY